MTDLTQQRDINNRSCIYHVVKITECPKLVGSQSMYYNIAYTVFRRIGLSDTVHSRNQYLTWEQSTSTENSSSRRHSPISPPERWARSGRSDQRLLGDHQTEKKLGEMHTAIADRIFPNTEFNIFRSRGFLPPNAPSPRKVTELRKQRYGIICITNYRASKTRW